jgi:hypothetical protein
VARTGTKPATEPDDNEPIEGEFDNDQPGGGAAVGALATVRGGAMKTQTSYHTAIAVQKPRSMAIFTAKVVEEAALCGEDFYFGWKQGGQQIEGVTIGGAMVMLRHYGNCALELDLVEEGPSHWIFKATFIDLESGMSLPRLFRQRKGESHQKSGGDAERNLDIAFQIAQSKCSRNVVLRAMPEWLVKKALAAAKAAEVDGLAKKLPAAIAKSKELFEKMGVKLIDLERFLGSEDGNLPAAKPEATWTANDTRILGALYRGIIARETSVPKSFPWTVTEKQAPTGEVPPAAGDAPPASKPEPTPTATAEQATPKVACVVCGKEVGPADAVYTGQGMAFRHGGCPMPAAAIAQTPAATPGAPPASTPQPTPTPAAQPGAAPAHGAQASLPGTPSAAEPPKGKDRRRRTEEGLEEPPEDLKLAGDEDRPIK